MAERRSVTETAGVSDAAAADDAGAFRRASLALSPLRLPPDLTRGYSYVEDSQQ